MAAATIRLFFSIYNNEYAFNENLLTKENENLLKETSILLFEKKYSNGFRLSHSTAREKFNDLTIVLHAL